MTRASSGGTEARSVVTGVGLWLSTAEAVSMIERPWNGRTPVTSS